MIAGDALERGLELLRERRERLVVGRAHLHHDRRLGHGALDEGRVGDDDARAGERRLDGVARDVAELVEARRALVLGERDDAPLDLVDLAVRAERRQDGDEALVLHQLRLGRKQLGGRLGELGAGGQLDVDDELTAVLLVHEVDARETGDREHHEEGAYRDDADHELAPHRPAQDHAIRALEAAEERLERPLQARERNGRALHVRLREATREHRVEREGDEERHEHGRDDREAELAKELADDAGHERDGEEHGDDRERGREDRQRNLLRALQRCGARILTAFEVLLDVLADDDGVVDEEADREREREQRHHVEREMQDVHDEERRDDARRQGDRADERRAQVEHEEEDDEDRHRAAEDDRDLDLVRVLADEARLLDDEIGLESLRERLLDGLELRAHGVAHGDGVGAGLLEHVEGDGGLAVDADARAKLLVAVLDARDVGEAHARAVLRRGDDEVADLVDRLQLADGANADLADALRRSGRRGR